MSAERRARTYRFAPLDRSGWLLGLSAGQTLSLAAGLLAAGTLLRTGAPAPAVLAPLVGAAAYAFATVRRRPVREWAPVVVRYGWLRGRRRHRWFAELPLLSTSTSTNEGEPPLPPFLAGLALLDVGPAAWHPLTAGAGVGVVRDHTLGTLSASISVCGQGFALVERRDQERLVGLWGDALGAFCTERATVSRLRVTEWSVPAGLAEHERALAAVGVNRSKPVTAYRELLADAAAATTRHEVLVTLTVDPKRIQSLRRDATTDDAAVEVLVEELRLLSGRLESAGLAVGPPLSVAQLTETLRLRCDPSVTARLERRVSSLAVAVGVVSRYNGGPLATEANWGHLRVDGACHRSYWVAEWPRLEVPANWLEGFLLHPGTTRTFALHYEPVAPSRSRRNIERDATKLATEGEQRARSGFRIGAGHRRLEAAVAEREAELVAGYAELHFCGFLTVSAADEASLARTCADYEQAAAQAGLELRALEGRHDGGFVCSLPVGRGLASR